MMAIKIPVTQNKSDERLFPWVYFIAGLNIMLHIAFYNTLGFHRDELLYFSLGQHLSAGYASVPPFTGFVAWLMIHTLGYSLFAARIIPMLLSGVLILLGAAITRELKGKNYAQLLAATAIMVAPFNLRGFSMLQPVCFDITFWSLIFWLTLKWMNTKEDKYLLFLGVAAGLGMMNKYLVALEIVALLLAMLFSSYRIILKKKAFYLAILIAFIIFLPNLIWQINHQMPVYIHMQALRDSQLVHVNRLDFFTDQVFISSMAIILAIPGLIALFFSRQVKPYRPLAIASLFILIILVILRGKSYYLAGVLPLWIAAGAVFWEDRIKRKFTKILLPALMVLITLPVLPMGLPVMKAEKLAGYFAYVKDRFGFDMPLRWETGKIHSLPQDYADMLGWDELAEITARAYQEDQDKDHTMIYAENYGEAGAIMVIGKKYHLPEPVCFSESFFYWFPRDPAYEIKTLIYINDEIGSDLSNLFTECHEIGKIRNPLAREFGTGVWLCSNPRSSINVMWRHRVTQITSPFHH
jgi:hypothetical protein